MSTPEPGAARRAADADRDAAVDRLSEAAARGELTLAEHEERVGRALVATTHDELATITADLAPAPTDSPGRRKPSRWVVSVMGGNDRRGRWRAGPKLGVVSVMGCSDLDLRGVELDRPEITITVVSIMGGSSIYVPDSADVDLGGFAFMGGNGQRGSLRPPRPGAPLIRVRAYSLMGGTDIWRISADEPTAPLREARRTAKHLGP